jgi:DNA polymerase-4
VAARPPTANDLTLFALAKRALRLAWARRVRVRHMRLICDRLTFPPAQLELFPADRQENETRDNLIAAIDRIRQRFGNDVVRMGRTLAA